MTLYPLTVHILWELEQGDGSSSEIASCMGLHWKIVAGTLCNMKKSRYVRVVGRVQRSGRGGPGFIFSITETGRRHISGLKR